MDLAIREDAAFVIVALPEETGPRIDIHLIDAWIRGNSRNHRKALFVAALQALGELGSQVIPEPPVEGQN